MPAPSPKPRRYGGLDPADRHAARRERLLDAGLEVFGTEGYAASAIEPLCARAGVATRAFYEHFATKEDLLVAVYDREIGTVFADVAAALSPEADDLEAQCRAGVSAFVTATTRDPRRARIQLLEVVGVSDRLERHRRAVHHEFARIIERDARRLHRAGALAHAPTQLTSRALVGATAELLVDWMYARRRPSLARVIDALTAMYVASLRAQA
jgi:AcrR family transcriptional regulator